MEREPEGSTDTAHGVEGSKQETGPNLAETLLYLEIAQRSAGMGYIALDPATMRLSLSPWVREVVGSEEPTIPVADVPRFLVASEQERVMSLIAEIVAAQQPFEFETILASTNGPMTVRIAGNAVYASDGINLAGFYAILQDIDQIRKSENEARQSAERAQKELQARTTVATILSHEIRTPLTGIIGIIDQLRREPRIEERQRGLALIEEAAQALLVTLDSVLQQARSDDDVKREDQATFDPGDVVRRVAELFRPLARRKGLTLECRGPNDGTSTLVLGSAPRLQQILSNAISNAIKFTSSGRVELACEGATDAQPMWRFTISDTGCGISRKRLDTIFEPLAGSEADTLGRLTGTGLGLSIMKEVVDELEGTLSIESDMTKGTRVAVEIPYVRAKGTDGGSGPRGTVIFHCAAASRAIAVSAIAENCGLVAQSYSSAAGSPAEAFVCDEELLNQVDDRMLERFSTILIVTETPTDPTKSMHAGLSRIQANRLGRDLPGLLSGAGR